MVQDLQKHNFSYTNFILTGFPGFLEKRQLLFIPFSLLFILAIGSNSVIIHTIRTVHALQSPMYMLICTKAAADLSIIMTFAPKMLLFFLFDWNEISLTGCLIQMFFVHLISSFQSSILLVMALDRYVAICNPLRYNDYINNSNLIKIFVALLIRNSMFIIIFTIAAGYLTFCMSNVIENCYCDHMSLVSLACENTLKNNIMGLAAIIFITVVDLLFIIFSYCNIFNVVLKTASGKARQKAFDTCSTHLIVILFDYLLALCSYLMYRVKNSFSADAHILVNVLYLMLPSCFNPVIYGVRIKEIRELIVQKLKGGKMSSFSITAQELTVEK
ncbi:olfactory receptor 51E2-like [Erpetoichthys calabaricus]|uniref:olfactory receptor 51E2-like n=1 Tax=Erpetoichthys calabaricus TaxID=27687 RepID=UPI0010A043D3|nr:olfactory receptor 51E2-like [Erpetoichthys calabaricus]